MIFFQEIDLITFEERLNVCLSHFVFGENIGFVQILVYFLLELCLF